ncbi:Rab11 family-interacting protein 2 [Dissostichus eleginoides]|uniref:Rab11 family-interacting protein 2 n=1 Tax=Dissostichus eleginoides TaxID=100907 RepID=A0AAD9F9H4_DISEL|nr:Rab11 family-interacting protein 2 [Dissostichus eleginoides]
MSLADQSQTWFPTSVQVTVHQARNLRPKGKNGTNDAYAIMQVAKDKFSTSVSEKCIAPVWKEEASFDLPLFHPGNADRCTLHIIVMHRAQVGLDKFLGQAVVNLLDLHDNKSSKKTDWFKMVDKSGKEDKARGEVLLDIQFMRNNMSASMFDLSMQDKPRSRISKLKDKVRGKKKDGFSDSASAIVPSVSNVLTDSEGEADAQSLNQSPGVKKKSRLKTLFAPKSNLQKNMSQSMSTLGTLPEKNSSLSSSRSSGLNVDSPDVKRKFKFLGHKRTGSSDSKVSQGAFSLLGRHKHSNSDINSTCINGNHVYAEDEEPKSGSTLSLNSSGQGSVEDVRKHTTEVPVDAFVSVPSYKQESDQKAILEQQHERRKAEEQKRQEDASMSDRLSSLFGMIRKKEEKKEEPQTKEEFPTKSPRSISEDPEQPTSHRSTNPFEDISLSPDQALNESPADHQKSSRTPQGPSAMTFLNRSAKVSAVKPRFTPSLESEPADCQTPSQLCPSPETSETSLSSVPSESPDTFSSLHSSLAPPNISQSPSGSPRGSVEDLSSVGSSPTMADKKRRAPGTPSYSGHGSLNGGNTAPVREITNPAYVEAERPQQGGKVSIPLPDYESLFPQKRHGVQGHTRWDHLIAEVNQKHRDSSEMSVDGPEEQRPSVKASVPQESAASRYFQSRSQDIKSISSKKAAAPAPTKSIAPPQPRSVADSPQRQSQSTAQQYPMRHNLPAVPEPVSTNRESPSGMSRDGPRKALRPSTAATHAPRPTSQMDSHAPLNDQRQVGVNKEIPTAKPRQRASGRDSVLQEDSAATPVVSDKHLKSNLQTSSRSSMSNVDKKAGKQRRTWTLTHSPLLILFPKTRGPHQRDTKKKTFLPAVFKMSPKLKIWE